jgi:hypothetical protein
VLDFVNRVFRVEGLTFDNMIVAVAGNAFYAFVILAIVALLKKPVSVLKRHLIGDQTGNITGRWYLYLGRMHGGDMTPHVADLRVRRGIFSDRLRATWRIENLKLNKAEGFVIASIKKYVIVFGTYIRV